MIQKPLFVALAIIALAFAAQGCQPYCESLPSESFASVRILNAVSNAPVVLVYIDGKLFDSAYYDLINNYVPGPTRGFGERDSYRADGTKLRAGAHRIVAVVPSSIPGEPGDSIVKSDYVLFNHPQTLIYYGKVRGTPTQAPRVMYLNDNLRSADLKASYARFIDAVPDIGTDQSNSGIDVFFSDSATPRPDLRMSYGTISDNTGGGNGTGLSANDYVQIKSPQGLLITPTNDTLSQDNILKVPYSFNTGGLLFTIVVRGETKPVGDEPPVSIVLLEDAQESPRGFSKVIETFGVRVVNSTHIPSLSLLVKGSYDQGPRNNIPSGGGLLNLAPDSVGNYIPFSTDFHATADFWFSNTSSVNDTTGHLLYHFKRTHSANERSTYIAIDTIPHDSNNLGITLLELNDTVAPPDQSSMGRVRFVNTSADYNAQFTFAGKTFNLKQRDVVEWDAPVGSYSIPISNGTAVKTSVPFNLTNGLPVTVFFMPSSGTETIPYRISTR